MPTKMLCVLTLAAGLVMAGKSNAADLGTGWGGGYGCDGWNYDAHYDAAFYGFPAKTCCPPAVPGVALTTDQLIAVMTPPGIGTHGVPAYVPSPYPYLTGYYEGGYLHAWTYVPPIR